MRVEAILPAGSWDTAREIDQVLIDYDRRFRRRIVLTTVRGTDILIDEPQAVRLRDGDGLLLPFGIPGSRRFPGMPRAGLPRGASCGGAPTKDGARSPNEDGYIVRVCAQAEDLMEIHAHRDADLVRIAWHLGNRHLPVQLLGNRIRIRADHVIKDMVVGLGGHVDRVMAPFDPEAGAYAGGHHPHGDEDHGH